MQIKITHEEVTAAVEKLIHERFSDLVEVVDMRFTRGRSTGTVYADVTIEFPDNG